MVIETFVLSKGKDEITVEILEDGTVKSTTGKFGAVNHQSAEAFFETLAKTLGGMATRTHRGDIAQAHSHSHGEEMHSH